MLRVKQLLKQKSLKNGGLYLFGNLFNKAIAFITVPIFTRMLTTSEYGIVSTYSSWVLILAVIVGLSLGNTVRNAYVDYHTSLYKYFSSVLFCALLNFVFLLLICFCIIQKVQLKIETPLIIFCLIESFGSFVINAAIMKYVMEEKALKRTIFLVLPNLISTIISIILLMNIKGMNYYGRIIPTCIVTAVFGFGLLFYYFYKGRCFVKREYWSYALSLSLPLIFHSLSTYILSISDRSLIAYFCGTSDTGIYSLVYSFSMIATVIISSAEYMWIPFFTKKLINNKKDIINKTAKFYIEIITVVISLLIMVSPEILVLLASKDYWSGKFIIAPIVLASYYTFLYSISVNAEFYYKKTKFIAFNTVIAAAINIILNIIFIPVYGAFAAAYTTLISYIISFVIHYLYMKKVDCELFPFKLYIKPVCLIMFLALVMQISLDYWMIRWSLGLFIGIFYIMYLYKKLVRDREI